MSTSIRSRCCEETALTLSEGDPARLELHQSCELLTLDAALRRGLPGRIVLSAWSDADRARSAVAAFRAAGTRVAAAFGPGTEEYPWRRCDLGSEVWPEEPARPAEYRYLPLPDTPEQREKFPAPFRDGIGFVTIHNTAEPFSARDERKRVENRRGVRTSFHFAVDEREIVQLLPLGYHGWHAGDGDGDGNLRSVGIEICRSVFQGENGWLYRHAERNAVYLAAALLRTLDLPASALRMHRDWSGKYCPHRIIDAGTWDDFVSRTQSALDDPETLRFAGMITF